MTRFVPVSLIADKIRQGDTDPYWILLAGNYLRNSGVGEESITEWKLDPAKLAHEIVLIDRNFQDTVETEIDPPKEKSTINSDTEEVPEAETTHREGKGLTSKELEVFLEDYEKYKQRKSAREIAGELLKNSILAKSGVSAQYIERLIEVKQRQEERVYEELRGRKISENEARRIADLRSDEITRAYERIEIVDVERLVTTKQVEKLAEIIVEKPDERVAEQWLAANIKVPELEKTVLEHVVPLVRAERVLNETVVLRAAQSATETLAGLYGFAGDSEKKEKLTRAGAVLIKENLIKGNLARAIETPVNMDESKPRATGSSTLDKAKEIGGEGARLSGAEAGISLEIKAANSRLRQSVSKDVSIARAVAEVRKKLETLDMVLAHQETGIEISVDEAAEIAKLTNNEEPKEKIKIVGIEGDLAANDPIRVVSLRVVSERDLIDGKITLSENEVVEMAIVEEFLGYRTALGNKNSEGTATVASQQAVVVNNLIGIAKKGGSIRTVVDRINKIPDNVGTNNIKLNALRGLAKKLSADNYALVNSLEKIAKFTNFQDGVSSAFGNLLARTGQTLGSQRIMEAGVQLMYRWGGQTIGNMATHIAAAGGVENGLVSILAQLMKTGTVTAVKMGATAAEVGGVAAADAAAVAAAGTGVGVPVAVIIFAATELLKKLKTASEKALATIGNILNSLAIMDPREWENFKSSIGRIGGTIVAGVGAIGTAIIAIFPIMMQGLVFPVMIVVITIVAIPLYNHLQTATTQVSPLVINKGALNSSCIKKSEVDGTPAAGEVNCNKNAPEVSYPGVDKSAFVAMANRWSAGQNSAEACFNDVVNRALCAGVNPAYVLWAWLHESGASNYTISGVKDFGIYGQASVPAQDFNAQINYFLKLDPGSKCLGQPGIGSDYWLGFATNYLNGTCNPDEQNKTNGETGRQYLEEMKTTWGWVTSQPMPSNIKVSKGGSCGPGARADGKKEIVGPDGEIYICDNSQDQVSEIIAANEQAAAGTTYDPNATGLAGEVIPGECTVANKVVLTKQCGQPWSSRVLAGEGCRDGAPGTICKAGCGPSSVSMMLRHGNRSLTPDNVIFRSGSAYSSMGCGGSSLSQAYTTLVGAFGGGAVKYDGSTSSCTAKDIGGWICAGKVVMVLADYYRNSQLGIGGHFVLAVAVQNGNIITADPYYSVSTPFDGKKAMGHIAQIRGCLTVNASAIK